MNDYKIREKIIDSVKQAKCVNIFAHVTSGTLYDPIQNFSVTISQDYPLDKDGWDEVKALLRKDLGAKKFRKVGNTLCMYIEKEKKNES